MTAPTREQSVLGWAIHCDLIDSRDIDQEFVKSILEKLKEFSDLSYAAGQAEERAACAKVCEDFADGTSAYEVHHRFAAYRCAYLIRKRGENENLS